MGADLSKLKLECVAIGSMPHDNPNEAVRFAEEYFLMLPFWPQMVRVSKNEDMVLQFLEGMPSCFSETGYAGGDNDLERFLQDYETIISKPGSDIIEKYAISHAIALEPFLEMVHKVKPDFAKEQITGPFTLAAALVDTRGKCAIFNKPLRDIIIKILIIKALWLIKKMKEASAETVPVLFIDEPSLYKLETPEYAEFSKDSVIEMLKLMSDTVKSAGAVSAVHCCCKCDWRVPIRSGVNMINLDAFCFSENLSVYSDDVERFLKQGGKIVWGVVPTLDKEALETADLDAMVNKFKESVNYLTKKGIDEKLIIDNSLVSTSCGAGRLSVGLAGKALKLTKDLSDKLKEIYK